MPFDFARRKHYSIDYEDVFNDINANTILDNPNIQAQFLRMWINILKEHDQILKNQLKTREDILKLNLSLQSEPEIFQLPLHYSNTTILLHFRVSIANEILSKKKSESNYIPLNEFTGKNSKINWTPVDITVDSYSETTDPIVMVPFLNNQYHYLVIDGNHRLTYKVKNNIDNIYGLIVSEQSVVECKIFSSSFDSFYYIMHNEINHMANETHRNRTNSLNLLEKSYLKDGRFKFK